LQLLEQTGLAYTGLATDVDGAAASRLPALHQRRFELPQFAVPSNKALAARAGRFAKGAAATP
jgi:hypothetical protein